MEATPTVNNKYTFRLVPQPSSSWWIEVTRDEMQFDNFYFLLQTQDLQNELTVWKLSNPLQASFYTKQSQVVKQDTKLACSFLLRVNVFHYWRYTAFRPSSAILSLHKVPKYYNKLTLNFYFPVSFIQQ